MAETDVDPEQHRALAVAANNSCWEILAKTADHDEPVVDADQAFDLLSLAYAAAHHWRAFNGPDSINAARAAWLCSRAHAVVGDGTAALRTAERCQALTEAAGDEAADFDHFYAAEAIARALACLGRGPEELLAARGRASKLLGNVTDPEDHKMAESDLLSGPWFRTMFFEL